MELWIYDHSTNTRRTVTTDAMPIRIGRDGSCDICLASPFVARHHARIDRKGNQLLIRATSQAGTRVANREVPHGKSARFDFGDEIQIGQFSLAMVGQTGAVHTQAATAQHQAALMQLEQQVHADLLERMNLRATGHINKADEHFVQQILQHLDQILTDHVAKLTPELITHCIRSHLRRLVIAEVVRQCQGRVQTDYRAADQRLLDARFERDIGQLVATIVDLMPLAFDAGTVTEDLAAAEQSFDGLFDQCLPSLHSTLQQYIVRRTVSKDITDILLGLGPLQDLLEMPSVTEIMVVGKDRIYIEKGGVIQPTTRSFFSDDVLISIIERILTPVGRRVDTSTPLVDARLPDGSRVNVVISPLSLVGPCMTIRKFGWVPFTMDDLIDRQSIAQAPAAFLQGCVVGRKNIVIAGGTGSGKTTLLNVLAAYARPTERIITIEESAELRLPQPHVVSMEGRPANVEGRGAYTIRELVRNALRMRPDRLIVGEVRGPEALDMLQAMNTGHDGSLSTVHANAPAEAIKRLETLVLMAIDMPVAAIREQIAAAIDIIVQVARLANGTRRVTRICQLTGINPHTGQLRVQDIFALQNPDDPTLRHTGYLPTFAETLIDRRQLSIEVFL